MAMSLGSKAQINMTPMIDVLLVLIIIFMVITPITPRGLNALVPQSTQSDVAAAPSRDIVVTVCGDHTLRLNQEPIELASLHDRLAALYATNPSHVLFVRGEKGLEFAPIAEVIDIARGAGLNRVALMTQ